MIKRLSIKINKITLVEACCALLILSSFLSVLQDPTYLLKNQILVPPIKSALAISVGQNIVYKYADYFQNKDYSGLWNLLSVDQKNTWASKQEFLKYMTLKYSAYSIASVETSYIGLTKADVYSRDNLNNLGRLQQYTISINFKNTKLSKLFSNLNLFLTNTNYPLVEEGGITSKESPIIVPNIVYSNASYHIPVLMYHNVAPLPERQNYESDYDYQLDYSLTVPPEEFGAQMQALVNGGYKAITPIDLLNAYYYSVSLPPKSIIITFDDGRDNVFPNTLSTLKKYNYPAIYFVCSQIVGTEQGKNGHNKYMTWHDIQVLSYDGMWVENHSLADNVDMFTSSRNQVQSIVSEASAQIYNHTGIYPQILAYSGHYPTPDVYDKSIDLSPLFKMLSQDGILSGYVDQVDRSTTLKSDNPYQVPRVRVVPNESIHDFLNSLN